MLPYVCMLSVSEIQASSILTPQRVGLLAGRCDFTLNPYAGCAFGCSYCYVPKFPNGKHHFSEWGKWVQVKTNAPELIRRERTKVFGSRIFFSSATDPYQYLELQYRLTRRCLEELLRYQPRQLTLHTRSHLLLQDLELIKSFGKVIRVGVSITTDDDSVRKRFEPNAPSVSRRLQLIAKLQEAKIPVYASIAPILPCNPIRLARLLAPHVDRIWIGGMNYPEVNTQPILLKEYASFFKEENHRQTTNTLFGAFNEVKRRSF
jgi:DNA repair photolyase